MSDVMKGRMKTAKLLRDLQIDEISSVDAGAGVGTRVTFHKRDQEADMAETSDLQKRYQTAEHLLDLLADDIQKKNPSMSRAAAVCKASVTPQYSEFHRAEREIMLKRLGY
jgi:hypothetical protein